MELDVDSITRTDRRVSRYGDVARAPRLDAGGEGTDATYRGRKTDLPKKSFRGQKELLQEFCSKFNRKKEIPRWQAQDGWSTCL